MLKTLAGFILQIDGNKGFGYFLDIYEETFRLAKSAGYSLAEFDNEITNLRG